MSQFVVSARKYRPARFEDVVGQEHITQTLKNALRSDHLAHAFLFCGPRGVGKTTCARILAKVLNCTNRTDDFEACDACSSCTAFNDSASFNIIELDAASNNSVEHIRTLIDQVRFQPQQGKYKVFIIDEVHMLSTNAFNAFLKTLEEPPPYAIFILATTEKHKIIPTILSRCQIFDFKRIQVPEIAAHLQRICDTESIQADAEALHVIAQKADGALRDALSIFDRMTASAGKRITYEHVIQNLNVLDYDYFFKLTDSLLIEDLSQILLVFDEILQKGFEPDLFLNGFAEHLRNLLVCSDPETLKLLEVSDALRGRYAKQASITPHTFLLTALNLINDCDVNYKLARNKRLHVELCLIKMTYIQRTASAKPFEDGPTEKKKPESIEEAPVTAAPIVPAPPVQETELQLPLIAEPTPSKPQEDLLAEKQAGDVAEPPAPASTPTPRKNAAHLVTSPRFDELLRPSSDTGASTAPEAQAMPLTTENLKHVWQEYIGNIPQETTRNLLQDLQVELMGDEVQVQVSSALVENALKEERNLMGHLRDTFSHSQLMMNITVVRQSNREAAKIEKPLSNKEKLLKMYEQNPNVKELAERFKLRFDND